MSSGKQKDTNGSYTPILTSKGRSLLTIALGNRNIGIVRYLVVEKRMLLWAEKDISIETLVQNLDLVLRILPEDILGEQAYDEVRERASGYGAIQSPSDNGFAGSTAFESTNSTHLAATTEEDLSAIRASAEMNGDFGSSHDEVGSSTFPGNWSINLYEVFLFNFLTSLIYFFTLLFSLVLNAVSKVHHLLFKFN